MSGVATRSGVLESEGAPMTAPPQKTIEYVNQQGMVNWFGPTELWRTGVRAAISAAISTYPDRRESMAALYPPANRRKHDYSNADELWFDFLADTGDGWNSTYSIAWC